MRSPRVPACSAAVLGRVEDRRRLGSQDSLGLRRDRRCTVIGRFALVVAGVSTGASARGLSSYRPAASVICPVDSSTSSSASVFQRSSWVSSPEAFSRSVRSTCAAVVHSSLPGSKRRTVALQLARRLVAGLAGTTTSTVLAAARPGSGCSALPAESASTTYEPPTAANQAGTGRRPSQDSHTSPAFFITAAISAVESVCSVVTGPECHRPRTPATHQPGDMSPATLGRGW